MTLFFAHFLQILAYPTPPHIPAIRLIFVLIRADKNIIHYFPVLNTIFEDNCFSTLRSPREAAKAAMCSAEMLTHLGLHCRTDRYICKLCLLTLLYSPFNSTTDPVYMFNVIVISNASKCGILAHVLVSFFIVRLDLNGEGAASVFYVACKLIFDSSYNPHEKNSTCLSSRLRYTAPRESSLSWIKYSVL